MVVRGKSFEMRVARIIIRPRGKGNVGDESVSYLGCDDPFRASCVLPPCCLSRPALGYKLNQNRIGFKRIGRECDFFTMMRHPIDRLVSACEPRLPNRLLFTRRSLVACTLLGV